MGFNVACHREEKVNEDVNTENVLTKEEEASDGSEWSNKFVQPSSTVAPPLL